MNGMAYREGIAEPRQKEVRGCRTRFTPRENLQDACSDVKCGKHPSPKFRPGLQGARSCSLHGASHFDLRTLRLPMQQTQ